MEEQIDRIDKLREVNGILLRNTFSHHPDCSEYDHHVIKLGQWRFCLGCTAMYSFIAVAAVADFFTGLLEPWYRFWWGLFFFIPALLQLTLRTEHRTVRFLMRSSLGVSVYLLLSFLVAVPSWPIKLIGTVAFVAVVRWYSGYQAGRQLRECSSCSFGEQYRTCLVKYRRLLEVDNLELIEGQVPQVRELLDLRHRRSGELIDLPVNDSEAENE